MTSELAPLSTRIRRALGSMSLADKVVYALVVLSFVGGFAVQPIWGWLDPRLPITEAYRANQAQDPWKRPWAEGTRTVEGNLQLTVYSVGPNGVDDGGRGDDVLVINTFRSLRRDVYGWVSVACLGISAFLAGGWELARAMRAALTRPRAASLLVELRRAAVLSLPFGLFAACAAIALAVALDEYLQTLGELLVVEPPVAAAGSAFVLCFGAVLWFRLRQPLAAEDPSPAPGGAAPADGR